LHALTKTYISAGLVFLALFAFWTAMEVFGVKGGSGRNVKLLMRMHRITGYVFIVYFVWISWVCVDLMKKLYAAGNYGLDARNFGHGALAIALVLMWGLKISFIRRYNKYRPYVPLLGIFLVLGTLLLWGIAGWMYLIITGARHAVI